MSVNMNIKNVVSVKNGNPLNKDHLCGLC